VKLFLDASVLLAACGRRAGGPRAVCDLAGPQGWRLLASEYVVREVEKNVRFRLPVSAQSEWQILKPALEIVAEVVTFDWPVVFTAAATSNVLLTLDGADFGGVMGVGFYGLPVMKPGEFLRRERAAGRLG
jgi:hypothetical protein